MTDQTENAIISPPSTDAQVEAALQARVKGGANWFFWIAGLSIVNSIIVLAGSDWHFVVGLGITQVVDAIASAAATEAATTVSVAVKAILFLVNLVVAGIVVLFGVLARRRHAWAFIVGMVLYGLDGLIFILGPDFLSIAFHIFALYGLFTGLRANNSLRSIEASNRGVA